MIPKRDIKKVHNHDLVIKEFKIELLVPFWAFTYNVFLSLDNFVFHDFKIDNGLNGLFHCSTYIGVCFGWLLASKLQQKTAFDLLTVFVILGIIIGSLIVNSNWLHLILYYVVGHISSKYF